jgi:hypothetical protein
MITSAGIIMAVHGRLAQTDSRGAVQEMRIEVREAIAQMNSNYAKLSADAFKECPSWNFWSQIAILMAFNSKPILSQQ